MTADLAGRELVELSNLPLAPARRTLNATLPATASGRPDDVSGAAEARSYLTGLAGFLASFAPDRSVIAGAERTQSGA